MKLSKKYLINILVVLCLTGVAMYFSLKDNFAEAMHAFSTMNIFFLALVLVWGMLYNAFWGFSYKVLGALYKKGYSVKEGITVAMVGTFFAGITPSATGGQFGQIYVLKKQGINYADGAGLLWADFIIYQTTMMIYVTILFALRFTHYVNLSAWFWIVFAGYLVNFAVVVGLYTMALFPKFYIKLVGWAVRVLGKMHIVHDTEAQYAKWTGQMQNFTKEVKRLSQDKSTIFKCMFVNFIRLTMYFTLPFVVALGLHAPVHFNQLIDFMALSSFVTMANSFIPLPGASGGTEVVFTLLFSSILKGLTGADLLLWRMSSYYIPVIAGAVIFILFKNHYDRLDEIKEEQAKADKEKDAKAALKKETPA